jgi:hypothetical protein
MVSLEPGWSIVRMRSELGEILEDTASKMPPGLGSVFRRRSVAHTVLLVVRRPRTTILMSFVISGSQSVSIPMGQV